MTHEEDATYLPVSVNAAAGCSLVVDRESAGGPILSLVGEIDLGSAPKMYSMIWQSSDKGRSSLIINMDKLDFMDSSGLQLLLRLREKLKSKKQSVVLVGPRPHIKRLFQLTGFDKLFDFFPTTDEAVSFLGEQAKSPKRAS